MANHASALKAHRQSIRRKNRNKSHRSSLKTALKKFSEQVKSGAAEEAKTSLSSLYSLVDRSVQKKVISRNAAARQKSRLTKSLNATASDSAKA